MSFFIMLIGVVFVLFSFLIFIYPQLIAYLLALGFLFLGVGLLVLGYRFRMVEKSSFKMAKW